jgi:hypothetical protein
MNRAVGGTVAIDCESSAAEVQAVASKIISSEIVFQVAAIPCGWRPHATSYRLKNRHRLRILEAGLQWTSELSGLLIKGSQ